ncbi:hypothetical protein DUNSADRAFT_15398 [Dunaliella salina]|uniref:Encoded protein n=1 Tax=Dunaliella salina TaxID=3046 RepID=A0ABQ7G5G8_DUNSA|nr:hypothetical protein DUNSADRAFT_15398 [Dunaliella salina]KAF5829862.1 hypothetical protein DUNSADRAFT_15398 [Dunaliella salina]|eukprot:KAF5829861.1 hypothetical protein DUNSADRAFT_15398 [Dunaliella salina]
MGPSRARTSHCRHETHFGLHFDESKCILHNKGFNQFGQNVFHFDTCTSCSTCFTLCICWEGRRDTTGGDLCMSHSKSHFAGTKVGFSG